MVGGATAHGVCLLLCYGLNRNQSMLPVAVLGPAKVR